MNSTFEKRPILWSFAWLLVMCFFEAAVIVFLGGRALTGHLVFSGVVIILTLSLYWHSSKNTFSGFAEKIPRFLVNSILVTGISLFGYFLLYVLQNMTHLQFEGFNPGFKPSLRNLGAILLVVMNLGLILNGYFQYATIRKYGLVRGILFSFLPQIALIPLLFVLPSFFQDIRIHWDQVLMFFYSGIDMIILPAIVCTIICHKRNIPSFTWALFLGAGGLFFFLLESDGYHGNLLLIPMDGKPFGTADYVLHAIGIVLQIALIVFAAYLPQRQKTEELPAREESTLIDNE